MIATWSFGRKIGAGFALAIGFTLAISAVAVYALRSVVASKDELFSVHARTLIDAERLDGAAERRITGVRGFLLTGEPRYLDHLAAANSDFHSIIARLRRSTRDDTVLDLLSAIDRGGSDHQQAVDRVVALRRAGAPSNEILRLFDSEVIPRRNALSDRVRDLLVRSERQAADAREQADRNASRASTFLIAMAVLSTLLSAVGSALIARALSRRIRDTVQQILSSSTELQATANEQATGSREQATAMNEITTTMTELLATSRQIADSAQRVTSIAQRTSARARDGVNTVDAAHESVGGIEKQVSLIATHMLDLGKKSQQIGGILQLIDELADQTNILAINATIEAAGAGDSGRRFAVVADEIRKLADRVGGSTREIRELVDEIRSAVNTTVMATERGAKSVEAGTRAMGDVRTAFAEIVSVVSTTADATREIELSTKQQTTAVEQVNVAIGSTAQATRETESTSRQVLQTASELNNLSRDLGEIVEPHTAR